MNQMPSRAGFGRMSGLALALTLIFALLLSGCAAPAAAPAAEEAPAADAGATEAESGDGVYVTVFGETLPEGALPYDQQVYRTGFNNTANATTFDFFAAVYQRYCAIRPFFHHIW